MTQEATIVAIDDSDFMRNGDFVPNRMHAQTEAVNLVCQNKRQRNPENTLGLLALARIQVLCTLTTDASKVFNCMHKLEPKGNICFGTSIKIARLALRTRQVRHQKMRVVCFVGSPISDSDEELTKLAKKLRKENVNIDVINFGEIEANQEKLSSFIDIINGKDGSNSHLVSVPSGSALHESLMSSPILAGENGTVPAPGMGLEFGLDANEDPDLLHALRVSMEEQRMRQEQEGNAATAMNTQPLPEVAGSSDEAMLRHAIALSVGMDPAAAAASQAPSSVSAAAMDVDLSNMTEEEQIAYALQMSLQQSEAASEQPQPKIEPDTKPSGMEIDQQTDTPAGPSTTAGPSGQPPVVNAADLDIIKDVDFLQRVLKNLPNVDPQSEEVRKTIDGLTNPPKKSDKDENDKPDPSAPGGSDSK